MLEVRLNQPMALDPKGRITLPVRLKNALDVHRVSSLVFIVHGGHLRAYTPDEFVTRVEKPLMEQDGFDPGVEETQRLRLGFATEVEVDRQGRLLLPANLRAMAGLDREVVVMSLLERLEVWDPARLSEWYAARSQRAVIGGGEGA